MESLWRNNKQERNTQNRSIAENPLKSRKKIQISMYNEQLESLIDAALADGVLTEKEKQILFKKAQTMGIDLDEFEMVLDARLVKLQKAEQEKAASAAPKSNKFGDVKKCPACGAIVQSFQGKCPECGYAFEGIEANSVAKELSKQLQFANDQNQMIKVIESFPIPMDKTVLIDFISWLKPQCLDVKNPLAKSYSKKYEECIQKARISFANDKELSPLIAEYDVVRKRIKKAKFLEILKMLLKKWWFWIVFITLIILVITSISNCSHRYHQKQLKTAIITALENNDLITARKKIIDYEHNVEFRQIYIAKCLDVDDIGEAESFFNAVVLKDVSLFWHEPEEAIKKSPSRKLMYDYFLQHKNYEKAEQYAAFHFTSDPFSDYLCSEHFEFITDVITELCKDGKKEEARKMASKYIEKYEWEKEGELTKPKVTKKITNIINGY